MPRRRIIRLAVIAASGLMLSSCTSHDANDGPVSPASASGGQEQAASASPLPSPSADTRQPAATQAAIELEQTALPVVSWKMDSSHIISVKGKVVVDGNPVQGVEVGLAGKRMRQSDDNGEFEIMVDRSVPKSLPLAIGATRHATVQGKALAASAAEALQSVKSRIDVYYPIQVMEVTADRTQPDQVEVHARAVLEEGGSFPLTLLDKYMIEGTVKDAKGDPVEGAMVSFTRENGEGWSKSEPANAKGEYSLFYSPEEDEDLYLSVHLGDTQYTLPEGRVYRFPEGTSVHTDIVLPESGTVITDQPPTLVSKPAEDALYWAQAIGVAVDPSISYSVSLPRNDGTFVLKIARSAWEQSPSFFQTSVRIVSDTALQSGDFIPSSVLAEAQREDDPSGIAAQLD